MDHTIASSLRNRCSRAGPSSTTLATPIQRGEQLNNPTDSAWWVGSNMATFVTDPKWLPFQMHCLLSNWLLVSLRSGLVTEPKWRPFRDPGTSKWQTIFVFLENEQMMERLLSWAWGFQKHLHVTAVKFSYAFSYTVFSPIINNFSENGGLLGREGASPLCQLPNGRFNHISWYNQHIWMLVM